MGQDAGYAAWLLGDAFKQLEGGEPALGNTEVKYLNMEKDTEYLVQ